MTTSTAATASQFASTFLMMPIPVTRTHYRNPHTGEVTSRERVDPNTQVVTKCCKQLIRKAYLSLDHNKYGTCRETIPTELNESHKLKDRATHYRTENAAEVKIVRVNTRYGKCLEIPVNPFTNQELTKVTDPFTYETFELHEGIFAAPAEDAGSLTTSNAKKFFENRLVTECGVVFNKTAFLERAASEHKHTCPNNQRTCNKTLQFEGHPPEPSTYGGAYNASTTQYISHSNTLISDETIKAPFLGTWALACAVGYVSLLTLSSTIFGTSLLLLGASSMLFSIRVSNEFKTDYPILVEKIALVATAIFIPAACSYYGAALLGFSATTQIATTVASVALPCIYHVANMLT